MINRRRSGVRGTPAKVNANAGLAASDKVNSASVSDGSHESVYLGPFYVLTPYDDWLDTHAMRTTSWWERAVDGFIHAELLFIKLPFLFLNPWASRCTQWADAAEQVRVRDQPARLITAS